MTDACSDGQHAECIVHEWEEPCDCECHENLDEDGDNILSPDIQWDIMERIEGPEFWDN